MTGFRAPEREAGLELLQEPAFPGAPEQALGKEDQEEPCAEACPAHIQSTLKLMGPIFI